MLANLREIQEFILPSMIENTVRQLGVDIEDAQELADPEEIESPPAQAGAAAIDSNEA